MEIRQICKSKQPCQTMQPQFRFWEVSSRLRRAQVLKMNRQACCASRAFSQEYTVPLRLLINFKALSTSFLRNINQILQHIFENIQYVRKSFYEVCYTFLDFVNKSATAKYYNELYIGCETSINTYRMVNNRISDRKCSGNFLLFDQHFQNLKNV